MFVGWVDGGMDGGGLPRGGFWAGQGSSLIGLWRCCSASGSASEQRDFGDPELENLNLLVAIRGFGAARVGVLAGNVMD